ncbi:MAG: hypothetical protein V7K90_28810 [Nostoc sp.]|uniref:hypothetical protein n=1 Tax=Nostoc sp. TaxID=1180 RepID=UPI002FFB034C
MTQKLDQIEAILERTAQRAEANTGAMFWRKAALCVYAQLHSTVNSLVQVVEIHHLNHEATQRNFEAIVIELREIRSEIRWLRIENQRILEHLFA